MCQINWEVIVELIGIIVNAFLAIWIVTQIQKNQNNERSIKDHFINEVIELRVDCRNFLKSVYLGSKTQNEIISSLQLIGIKSTHLMNVLNFSFRLDKSYLDRYIYELNQIITGDSNFEQGKSPDAKIEITKKTQKDLLKFQSDHQHTFNGLILGINEAIYNRLN